MPSPSPNPSWGLTFSIILGDAFFSHQDCFAVQTVRNSKLKTIFISLNCLSVQSIL